MPRKLLSPLVEISMRLARPALRVAEPVARCCMKPRDSASRNARCRCAACQRQQRQRQRQFAGPGIADPAFGQQLRSPGLGAAFPPGADGRPAISKRGGTARLRTAKRLQHAGRRRRGWSRSSARPASRWPRQTGAGRDGYPGVRDLCRRGRPDPSSGWPPASSSIRRGGQRRGSTWWPPPPW